MTASLRCDVLLYVMPTIFWLHLMPSVSSNILPFSVDLILGNKRMSGGDKLGEYEGGDLGI
jgi:hypothetical protein